MKEMIRAAPGKDLDADLNQEKGSHSPFVTDVQEPQGFGASRETGDRGDKERQLRYQYDFANNQAEH